MKVKSSLTTIILCILMGAGVQARYYDPAVGRFISPDAIVQDHHDPQSLNRYAYVRNNPVNLIDPTGYSWLSKTISKVVPFVNPFIQPSWTVTSVQENKEAYIAGAMGFITSGGNPVVGAAAFWTEMGMQTGEGRQITDHVAHEVFMDVFGMKAQTAYIFSNVGLRIVAISAMESMYSRIAPNQLQKVPLPEKPANIEGGSVQEGTVFGPSAKGGDPGDNYYALVDSKGNRVGTIMDRRLASPKFVTEPLNLDHTGVNIIGYNGSNVPGPLYGSWGVCHTATNHALFQAGYGSTASSLGVGGWSTGLTRIIYGNYGGGLYRMFYWGYDARY